MIVVAVGLEPTTLPPHSSPSTCKGRIEDKWRCHPTDFKLTHVKPHLWVLWISIGLKFLNPTQSSPFKIPLQNKRTQSLHLPISKGDPKTSHWVNERV